MALGPAWQADGCESGYRPGGVCSPVGCNRQLTRPYTMQVMMDVPNAQEESRMTPNHQHIVDAVLLAMQRRVSELVAHCQQGTTLPEQPLEQLRNSPLGGHLAAIARYAEGYAYPYEGDVRASATFLARCLYGDPL